MSAYEDLLGHHLLSARNLIASTPDNSYPNSTDGESVPTHGHVKPERDYSGIRDLGAFLSFQAAADYCLTCSDDSSEGDYDPTREYFIAEIGHPDDDDAAADAAHILTAAVGATAAPGSSTPANIALQQAQLAQFKELESKLEEEPRQTQKLRIALEQERTGCGTGAREAGRVARERIMADDREGSPLALTRASQKITAAALLLRAMPEGGNLRKEAQALLEDAAVQQAKSSASRMHSVAWARAGGVAQQDRKASVHTPPAGEAKALTEHDRVKLTPAKDRLWDTRGNAHDGDARNILNRKKDGAVHGYHPRCGGRYDSREDRSPSPEPPGTRVFSREIRAAPFPPRFRQSTTLTKYAGETDPGLWLNDYRLVCQLGGATNDAVII
jgi:hypothetical protein